MVTEVVERTGSTAMVQVRLSGMENPGNVWCSTCSVTHHFPDPAASLHHVSLGVSLECGCGCLAWRYVWATPVTATATAHHAGAAGASATCTSCRACSCGLDKAECWAGEVFRHTSKYCALTASVRLIQHLSAREQVLERQHGSSSITWRRCIVMALQRTGMPPLSLHSLIQSSVCSELSGCDSGVMLPIIFVSYRSKHMTWATLLMQPAWNGMAAVTLPSGMRPVISKRWLPPSSTSVARVLCRCSRETGCQCISCIDTNVHVPWQDRVTIMTAVMPASERARGWQYTCCCVFRPADM